jgi:hypothetical protein
VEIIAEAIEHAHSQGILHRDPAVERDHRPSDQPCITDSGLAKNCGKPIRLTATGEVFGSPDICRPSRRWARAGKFPPRVTFIRWGVAVSSAHRRATVPRRTLQAILLQVLNRDLCPPADQSRTRWIWKQFASSAWERNRPAGYATARELAEDLGRFLRDEPVLAAFLRAPAKRGVGAADIPRSRCSGTVLLLHRGVATISTLVSRAHQSRAQGQRESGGIPCLRKARHPLGRTSRAAF